MNLSEVSAWPKGIKFFDVNSNKEMLLCEEKGGWNQWLFYKHPDGQWVSIRKATELDLEKLKR